ncbi:hypothetical protein ACHAWF_018644 [Thalassiosira exigua]
MDLRRLPGARVGSGGDDDGSGCDGNPPPPTMSLRLPAALLASLADVRPSWSIVETSRREEMAEMTRQTRSGSRLEEERRKRKEIVTKLACLAPNRRAGPGPRRSARGRRRPGRRTEARRGGKTAPQTGRGEAKGKPGPKPGSRKQKRRVVPPDVDGWSPDVHHLLLQETEKDDRSNAVRIHVLPLYAMPEKVRKFFHGLNPSSISVLSSSQIPAWDARYDPREGKVERHRADFCVYARFAWAPVADVAMERSEEPSCTTGGKTSGTKKYTGAEISLSPVLEHVASFLLKKLAICADKGVAIGCTVAKVERWLCATATEILWQMASKQLRLKGQISSKRCIKDLGHLVDEYVVPTDESVGEGLFAIDLHKSLEVELGLLLTHAFDPSCSEDPTHAIAQAVPDWLLAEIYIMKHLLMESWLMMEP